MTDVQLISETLLKQATVVNENVDTKYINDAIITAQNVGLQPLIGTALYTKLCDLVKNGSITASANAEYKKLLNEYVARYLCHKATADVQWSLLAKLRNNGIVTSQDQQTQQMSMENCELLRKRYDDLARFYGKRMTDYLCANAADFPEWRQRNSVADIAANKDAYNTGIVL